MKERIFSKFQTLLFVGILNCEKTVDSTALRQGQRSGYIRDSERPHFRSWVGWCDGVMLKGSERTDAKESNHYLFRFRG